MLKPMWMLEGHIDKVKRIEVKVNGQDWIEDTYEDENGDRAIVSRPATRYELLRNLNTA